MKIKSLMLIFLMELHAAPLLPAESTNVDGSLSDTGASISNAYEFLKQQMDQYHKVFYIYKDHNSGGNTFIPGGWMGDHGDITSNAGWINHPAEGNSCLRLDYSADLTQGNGWAGIYWLSFDKNWGNKKPGYNLAGATRLHFSARGEIGGEQAIFKVGGVNWLSHYPVEYPFKDSCEAVAIGPITLSEDWKEYEIDLSTPELFTIYKDSGSASNHFVPSAWYNGSENMSVNESCSESPHSGETCVKITWNGQAGIDNWKWNGLAWEWPEGRISQSGTVQGVDLSGATELRFWVKVNAPDIELKFSFGHPDDSCGNVVMTNNEEEFISVSTNWTQMHIPVPIGTSMTNVTFGFSTIFNDIHSKGTNGFSIYLDDIEFDRPLQKDLSSLIGGFCWVTDTNMNPNGCTIYLDNIYFDKPRLDEPRFLQSYVTQNGTNEYILNNQAITYDNALALLAFTLAGDDDNLNRAKLIASAFMQAIANDRDFSDGRVRNVYRSGDVLDTFNGETLLAGWWDEKDQCWGEDKDAVGSKVGDVAWVAIALLQYSRTTGNSNALATAEELGNWIINNTWSDTGPGGFTGGYWGWPDGNNWGWYKWKSTEHNLDAWRLFAMLYEDTNNNKWAVAAEHGHEFVEQMWDLESGFFFTGTETNGVTINTGLLALDPNSWGVLSFWTNLNLYAQAVEWAEINCLTTNAGFQGFDFNNDRDGVWFEGTAQMALAYLHVGQLQKSESYLQEVRRAQQEAPNADGRGIVAACKDHLTTGLGWHYNARLHVGATSWYLFGEYGYNPFHDTILPRIRTIDVSKKGIELKWTSSGNYTCVVQSCEAMTGSWTNHNTIVNTPWEIHWTDPNPSISNRFYRLIMSKRLSRKGIALKIDGEEEAEQGQLNQNFKNQGGENVK